MPNKDLRGGEVLLLTDREMEKVRLYATAHHLTVDEAASQLANEAIAKKFGKNTGLRKAKVYPIQKH